MPHPLQAIEGAPETRLSDALAARLPSSAAPPPWEVRLQAAVWLHRATPAAHEQLPTALRTRLALPLTVGAVIRYLESPIGPYTEILASPVVLAEAPLPASVVVFMGVDSLASVRGGRANWALPKSLARFHWTPAPEAIGAPRACTVRVEGDDAEAWSVALTVRPRARAFPVRLPLRTRQVPPGEEPAAVPLVVAGRAHAATVDVTADGPTIPAWLARGRHPGFVVPDARATIAARR